MNFPGKNTGVDFRVLLQEIFLTQGCNSHLWCLLHWQTGSLPLSHLTSPNVSIRPPINSNKSKGTNKPKPKLEIFTLGHHSKAEARKEWEWSRSVVSNSFATPWTIAYQASLSTGFSRQEYWSGLPLPSLHKPAYALRKHLSVCTSSILNLR